MNELVIFVALLGSLILTCAFVTGAAKLYELADKWAAKHERNYDNA